MMDAITDPRAEEVVLMTCSQIGKTQILKNVVGYFIDQDPSPLLMIQPTLEMARSWSKERFTPMLRDTPALRGKVREARSKDSSNEILHKTFPGGHITIAGANSPASLAARPIRILLLDEVDRYPASAGAEGDPVKLAMKRTRTFWNRKIVKTSSPTTEGVSRIELDFNASSQCHYHVPCPRCSQSQALRFSDRSQFASLAGGRLVFDSDNCTWAFYECESCKAQISEAEKYRMVRSGLWIPQFPERITRPGFHISELYSTFSTWREIATDFLEAKKRRETLRVWVNTTLGETFQEEEAYTVSDEALMERLEAYEKIPSKVLVLTAQVDTQDDRFEYQITGWGEEEESWLIAYGVVYGAPDNTSTHTLLEQALEKEREHELGFRMKPAIYFVDSGGHFAQDVYRLTRRRQGKRYFSIKGFGGRGRPLVGKVTRNNREHAMVIPLGVDDAKQRIYDRLQLKEPGPGFMHFNRSVDLTYFNGLTSEKRVITRDKKGGFPTVVWKLKNEKLRNEPLDLTVYGLAAIRFLNPNFKAIRANLDKRAEEEKARTPETKPDEAPMPRTGARKRMRISGIGGRW